MDKKLAPGWTSSLAEAEIVRLISPGVIGFYSHFEVTEIIALRPGEEQPLNVLTIIAAEEREDDPPVSPSFLNKVPLTIRGLKDWKFGICQYRRSIESLAPTIERLGRTGEWICSGQPLYIAKLTPLMPRFVPPDAGTEVPLNRVLKNNFWNGSHLLEWSDTEKAKLRPLFEDPRRLQTLSEAIQTFIPIRLASLSDRLGGIIVQLPVTVLVTRFSSHGVDDLTVHVAWHPRATSRALRASCEVEFDGLVTGYATASVQAPQAALPMRLGQGVYRGVIWCDQHQVVLAATGESSFIETMGFKMGVQDPEPRTFSIPDGKGGLIACRVSLVTKGIHGQVGESSAPDKSGWTRLRMYNDEASRLAKKRWFVQYLPKSPRNDEHQRALDDLRFLMDRHGEEGAWLWDPYLSARDILETLFYCPHAGTDLRALGWAQKARELSTSQTTSADWIDEQRAVLENAKGNSRGLRLEYRVKIGQDGWGFHDRFLIFPSAEHGGQAWSLGTSINSLGIEHHILQKVSDGQLVMNAFLDLWGKLDSAEHLVWKAP